MAQITFEVDGITQLSRNLRITTDRVEDLTGFYSDAVDIIEDRTDAVFKEKGSNVKKSDKWKDLDEKTKKARKKGWGYYKKKPNSPSTLRWTGNLQDNKTKNVNKYEGSIAYNAKYAIYHQRGGKNLPKRAIIDLDEATNQKITKAMQKHITTGGVFRI